MQQVSNETIYELLQEVSNRLEAIEKKEIIQHRFISKSEAMSLLKLGQPNFDLLISKGLIGFMPFGRRLKYSLKDILSLQGEYAEKEIRQVQDFSPFQEFVNKHKQQLQRAR